MYDLAVSIKHVYARTAIGEVQNKKTQYWLTVIFKV
jgi:hypothetical protein